MRKLLLSLAAALALSACGSVVMSTAAVLGFTNPFTADPAGYEIAVTIPDGVNVVQDGVKFIFAAQNTVLNTNDKSEFSLQRRETTDDRSLFRFAPADLPEIRALQATTKQRELDNPDANSGSVSIVVTFCKIGDGPADDDTFNVSIRTKTDGRFLPLIRDASIKDALDVIDENSDVRDAAPVCPQ